VTARLNGCNGKPRPTAASTYRAQAGWLDGITDQGAPVRVPVYREIPHRMSTTCQYDKSASDPGCAGCHHGAKP